MSTTTPQQYWPDNQKPGGNDSSTIFIHIPKTAGTTLRVIIEDLFPRGESCFIYQGNTHYMGMDDFQKLSDQEKKRFRIFCGHLDFGLHRNLPQPCKYITMLREPIERVVSLYHHFLQEENARYDKSVADIQQKLVSGNLTFNDFVASGMTIDTDNYQTRVLSGESPEFGKCRPEILETAKRNLREHFAVVGLTERFDESVMLLHKIQGWAIPFYVKKNISKPRTGKAGIHKEELETIRRYNSLDIELYQFAEKLFEEQVEQLGQSFKRDVAEFKIANRYYATWFEKMNSIRELQAKIDSIQNSWSWRVTAPLRKAVDIFNKIK